MIDLICVFYGKFGDCINNLDIFTKVAPRTPTSHPQQPTLLSTGYNLDLKILSFIFLALLFDAIGGGERVRDLLNLFVTIK